MLASSLGKARVVSNPRILISYPREFLPKGGRVTTDEEARSLWQWRKNRPLEGHLDTEPFDKYKILQEVEEMRTDLSTYVTKAHVEVCLAAAETHGLSMDGTSNQHPKNAKDLYKAIEALQASDTNEHLVYNVCFAPFSSRQWCFDVVDEWLDARNMTLQEQVAGQINSNGKKRKFFHGEKGGFSTTATQAKSNATKAIMRRLYSRNGWKISSKCPKVKIIGEFSLKKYYSMDNSNESAGYIQTRAVSIYIVITLIH